MINKLSIKNYRALLRLVVSMERLNVITRHLVNPEK